MCFKSEREFKCLAAFFFCDARRLQCSVVAVVALPLVEGFGVTTGTLTLHATARLAAVEAPSMNPLTTRE
jgi:hypothetical protein